MLDEGVDHRVVKAWDELQDDHLGVEGFVKAECAARRMETVLAMDADTGADGRKGWIIGGVKGIQAHAIDLDRSVGAKDSVVEANADL